MLSCTGVMLLSVSLNMVELIQLDNIKFRFSVRKHVVTSQLIQTGLNTSFIFYQLCWKTGLVIFSLEYL